MYTTCNAMCTQSCITLMGKLSVVSVWKIFMPCIAIRRKSFLFLSSCAYLFACNSLFFVFFSLFVSTAFSAHSFDAFPPYVNLWIFFFLAPCAFSITSRFIDGILPCSIYTPADTQLFFVYKWEKRMEREKKWRDGF